MHSTTTKLYLYLYISIFFLSNVIGSYSYIDIHYTVFHLIIISLYIKLKF